LPSEYAAKAFEEAREQEVASFHMEVKVVRVMGRMVAAQAMPLSQLVVLMERHWRSRRYSTQRTCASPSKIQRNLIT
jgi:hypothetical protein